MVRAINKILVLFAFPFFALHKNGQAIDFECQRCSTYSRVAYVMSNPSHPARCQQTFTSSNSCCNLHLETIPQEVDSSENLNFYPHCDSDILHILSEHYI